MRRQPIAACALVALLAPLPVASGNVGGDAGRSPAGVLQPQPDDLERWPDMVTPIMTEAEAREFAGLQSVEDRSRFVEAFWQRRDPTPGTPANEARELYLQRLAFAERRFAEGDVPGYRTDRGRVLLVYGLPESQELRPVAAGGTSGGDAAGESAAQGSAAPAGAGPPAGPGELVWVYEPVNPHLQDPEVRFSPGAGEEEYVVEDGVELGIEAFLASIRGRLPLQGQQGREPAREDAASARMRILRDILQGAPARDDIGLKHRYAYFPAPEGNTFVAMLFEIDRDDLTFAAPTPDAESEDPERGAVEGAAGTDPVEEGETADETEPVGEAEPAEETEPAEDSEPADEIEPVEDDAPVREAEPETGDEASLQAFGVLMRGAEEGSEILYDFDISFEFEPQEDPSEEPDEAAGPSAEVHSLGLPLAPGSYRLVWGIMETASGRVATVDEELEVPDFVGTRLGLTSVLVHEGLEESTESVQLDRVYEGLRLGSVQISLDLDREFERGQTLEVLYMVVGAVPDETTQRPKLEIDHRVLRAEDGQSIARLPTQQLDYVAVGQQIPLAQIDQITPGDEYLVEIEVRDLVGGGTITERVPFTVAGEPAPSAP